MILDDVQWVVERSNHVAIDRECLDDVCVRIDPERLYLPDWRVPVVPGWRDERLVDYFFLFNSINFCYWGEPKWTVRFHGASYDGAFGMMAALTRALEEGYPLLDGDLLARLTREQFRHMFRGNVPIPLEEERWAILKAVGPVLAEEFEGRWHEVVRRAGGSAVRLIEMLAAAFPSFKDVAEYEGRRVPFYKRAQLAVGMTYQAFAGQGWGAFADFDQLTVYADYKLPQVLRRLGILVYDEALSALVDGQTPLAAGSRKEVEIRAATVWAGELIRRALSARAPALTAAHIDFWLWETGQEKVPGSRPYHRTRTTAY